MKKIIPFLMVFFLSGAIHAQKELTEVITADSVTKNELYSRAKIWVGKAFGDAKVVIVLDDKDNGVIILKPLIPVMANSGPMFSRVEQGQVKYTFTIEFKDGRYKYQIADIYHESNGHNGGGSGGSIANEKPDCGSFTLPKSMWKDIKEQTKSELDRTVASLKVAMATPVHSNW